VANLIEAAHIRLSLSEHHKIATLELSGEFDIAVEDEFEARVARALENHIDHLIIDLRALDFMDSTGLLMLLRIDALSRQDGFRLWIVNDAENRAGRVLHLTGLDKVLPLVDREPYLPD
jgi:anti-sigma B factor antagonist